MSQNILSRTIVAIYVLLIGNVWVTVGGRHSLVHNKSLPVAGMNENWRIGSDIGGRWE